MSRKRLTSLYILFAIAAVIVNLGTQRFVLGQMAGNLALPAAILCGTVSGMIVKYLLDKKWIFSVYPKSFSDEGRLFAKYLGTSILTTLVFWLSETSFWLVGQTELMREVGAVIGLGIGYLIKYRMDRAFVFLEEEQ